jgi:hypothetical protein
MGDTYVHKALLFEIFQLYTVISGSDNFLNLGLDISAGEVRHATARAQVAINLMPILLY